MLLVWMLLASVLGYDTPEGWVPGDPSSSMRLAQWSLPGEGADAAEAVIFYFGEGQGGGVEANLERWFGQFEQPDGSSTRERATVENRELPDLALTVADVSGTYVASVRPGARERQNRPGYRMIAAIAEGEGGPWYIRVLGPEATVSHWEDDVQEFFASLRVRVRMD